MGSGDERAESTQQFCEISTQTPAHSLLQSRRHRFILKAQIPQVLPRSKANTKLMFLLLFRASPDARNAFTRHLCCISVSWLQFYLMRSSRFLQTLHFHRLILELVKTSLLFTNPFVCRCLSLGYIYFYMTK